MDCEDKDGTQTDRKSICHEMEWMEDEEGCPVKFVHCDSVSF